jgi:hypothetical protein
LNGVDDLLVYMLIAWARSVIYNTYKMQQELSNCVGIMAATDDL